MSDKKEPPKKTSIFKKKSDAGKGDVPRLGISYEEWEQKYEKIFGKKEEPVRSHKSDNSSSES